MRTPINQFSLFLSAFLEKYNYFLVKFGKLLRMNSYTEIRQTSTGFHFEELRALFRQVIAYG